MPLRELLAVRLEPVLHHLRRHAEPAVLARALDELLVPDGLLRRHGQRRLPELPGHLPRLHEPDRVSALQRNEPQPRLLAGTLHLPGRLHRRRDCSGLRPDPLQQLGLRALLQLDGGRLFLVQGTAEPAQLNDPAQLRLSLWLLRGSPRQLLE